MATEVKVLQPEDWDLLQQAPDGVILDNRWAAAIVATENGKLVGRMYLCLMPHIEGTWVAEEKQGSSVGFRLERQLEAQARSMHVSKVLAYCTPEHETYMRRLGWTKANVTVWEKDLED